MLARHCGYNVVELNASDDRSPEAFRSALEGATQMKAVLGNDCRPNCLVIDEIGEFPGFVLFSLIDKYIHQFFQLVCAGILMWKWLFRRGTCTIDRSATADVEANRRRAGIRSRWTEEKEKETQG